jgi:hypothetical protein
MAVHGFAKRIPLGVVCWEPVDWSLVARRGNRWEAGVGGGSESSVGSQSWKKVGMEGSEVVVFVMAMIMGLRPTVMADDRS